MLTPLLLTSLMLTPLMLTSHLLTLSGSTIRHSAIIIEKGSSLETPNEPKCGESQGPPQSCEDEPEQMETESTSMYNMLVDIIFMYCNDLFGRGVLTQNVLLFVMKSMVYCWI
jgi:hypothetical protein